MTPINGIIAFFDVIANIPANYALCDGTLGTPDLNRKYLQGAILDADVGDLSGTATHQHTFTSDGHEHDISTTHQCPGGGTITAWSAGLDSNEVNTSLASGTTEVADNRPPSVFILWIMRIS